MGGSGGGSGGSSGVGSAGAIDLQSGWWLGSVFIVLTALIWSASSVLVQVPRPRALSPHVHHHRVSHRHTHSSAITASTVTAKSADGGAFTSQLAFPAEGSRSVTHRRGKITARALNPPPPALHSVLPSTAVMSPALHCALNPAGCSFTTL